MVLLYFMIFFCAGILPVNLENLLNFLPKTTNFGIGVVSAGSLIMGIISILAFGYYSDKISKKWSRKRIFIITNFIWIISYGLASLSINYFFYLFFIIISAIGTGAFVPQAFSMIGDFYSPKDRGKKYSIIQIGLILGSGMGIIFGGLIGSYLPTTINNIGWRIAYTLGFLIGLLTLLFYSFTAIEPERLRSEPEFEDYSGEIEYNYKITFKKLKELFKKKSISAILITVLCGGIANSTLGVWAIFYLSTKIEGAEALFIATTIFILAGSGALPGNIIGGRIGDKYFKSGKVVGRVLISLFGLILGISLQILFYSIPFFTGSKIQIIFSWIFFLVIGYLGFLFVGFSTGNQFAIYSEVALPEVRSTVNAMNGLMVNLGGIIGNFLIASMIESNISFLPFAVLLVLLIWLLGALFWIIPYFYYPRELKECRETLIERRNKLESKL
ncbi:MAG: MFS transporter [Candidatus Hermodarchaeota archaeon]